MSEMPFLGDDDQLVPALRYLGQMADQVDPETGESTDQMNALLRRAADKIEELTMLLQIERQATKTAHDRATYYLKANRFITAQIREWIENRPSTADMAAYLKELR